MRPLSVSLLPALLLLSPGVARVADPIPPGQFDRLHALIKPEKDEDRWASVGWRTGLWDARQEAARLGKPILLWEMDGHPLGCT
jgi:hypothetical protein